MNDLVEQLKHKQSAKRRSAAKRLRKLGDPQIGPQLLTALEQEVQDSRTWETQYQMIAALGEIGSKPALPFIQSLINKELKPTTQIAIGDAITRLSKTSDNDVQAALDLIRLHNNAITQGSLQAIAIMRVVPDEVSITKLIDFGLSKELGDDDWSVIWLLRATPAWPVELVEPLIRKWSRVTLKQQQQIYGAVELAQKQKYAKWSPL